MQNRFVLTMMEQVRERLYRRWAVRFQYTHILLNTKAEIMAIRLVMKEDVKRFVIYHEISVMYPWFVLVHW